MRGRLPTLPESVDEDGSAALVDAWLTSLKVDEGAKEAVERLTTSLDARSVDAANGNYGTILGHFKLHGPMERIVGGAAPLPLHASCSRLVLYHDMFITTAVWLLCSCTCELPS